MGGKRTYPDGCATAYALDVIGERWALLVVRELLYRPRRFNDLRQVLVGISTNSLSQRLSELQEHGLLVHRQLPPPADSWVYDLTPEGRALAPILAALGHWGSRLPDQRAGQPMSTASLTGAMHTRFDPTRAPAAPYTVGLRLGRDELTVTVNGPELHLQPGLHGSPDLTFTTTSTVLAQILLHGQDVHPYLETGEVTLDGDRTLLDPFTRQFPPPAPNPRPAAPTRTQHPRPPR